MSYFLSEQKIALNKTISLSGEEARHMLLSRRMKIGELVKLQDPSGKRYTCSIEQVGKSEVTVVALAELTIPQELPIAVSMFLSAVSEKALNFVFQKVTELGATGIVLFNSQNTATKLAAEQFKKKEDRWNKILWEAAKQSDRGSISQLQFTPTLDSAIAQASLSDQVFVLDGLGNPLSNFNRSFKSCSIVIGPEGGFSSAELQLVKSNPNNHIVSISPFTLRTETAAIAALATIQAQI